MWTRVSPPDHLGVAPRQRLGLGQPVRVEVRTPLAQRRPALDERGEVVGRRVEVQPRRGRGQHVGHDLERVEQRVEVLGPPRPARRAGGDVLDAEHHPVVVEVPQQPRGRHALRQGGELARLLAVGVGEHPLGLGRGRLHEVARAVLADQHGGEAGGEPARLGDRRDDGGAAPALDPRPQVGRQEGPLEPARGPVVRSGVGGDRGGTGHGRILHHAAGGHDRISGGGGSDRPGRLAPCPSSSCRPPPSASRSWRRWTSSSPRASSTARRPRGSTTTRPAGRSPTPSRPSWRRSGRTRSPRRRGWSGTCRARRCGGSTARTTSAASPSATSSTTSSSTWAGTSGTTCARPGGARATRPRCCSTPCRGRSGSGSTLPWSPATTTTSARSAVIEAAGGVLEDVRGVKRRYWVPTAS